MVLTSILFSWKRVIYLLRDNLGAFYSSVFQFVLSQAYLSAFKEWNSDDQYSNCIFSFYFLFPSFLHTLEYHIYMHICINVYIYTYIYKQCKWYMKYRYKMYLYAASFYAGATENW